MKPQRYTKTQIWIQSERGDLVWTDWACKPSASIAFERKKELEVERPHMKFRVVEKTITEKVINP